MGIIMYLTEVDGTHVLLLPRWQNTDFGLCRTWCPSLSGLRILCLRGKVPGREKQAKHGPGERGRCMLCPLPVRLGDCDPVTEKGLWPRKGEKPGGLESSAGRQTLFRGTGLSTPQRGVACIEGHSLASRGLPTISIHPGAGNTHGLSRAISQEPLVSGTYFTALTLFIFTCFTYGVSS